MKDSLLAEIFGLLLIKVVALGLIWWLFFRVDPALPPTGSHVYAIDRALPAQPVENE